MDELPTRFDPTDPDVIRAQKLREKRRQNMRIRMWIIALGVSIGMAARYVEQQFFPPQKKDNTAQQRKVKK